MNRPLRPRATSTLAIAPATATDRTAPLVFGIEERAFRAFVSAYRVPHTRVGRRIVVRVDVFLETLERLERQGFKPDVDAAAGDEPDDEAPADAEQARGANRILARIGHVRLAGGGR